MGLFAKGAVVLVPYPFSDLSSSKLRPAVVLADVSEGDYILCQITTKPYGSRVVVPIDPEINVAAGLRFLSYARPEKLFTGHESIVKEQLGVLNADTIQDIVRSIVTILH